MAMASSTTPATATRTRSSPLDLDLMKTVYSEAAYDKPQSGGSWSKMDDPTSLSGKVMEANASSPNGGTLFGPYITQELGGASMLGKQYTAVFRLKVSSNLSSSNVVYIDVACDFTSVLDWMQVKANGFASSNAWQDFQLTFTVPSSVTSGLEFRVQNLNNGVTDVFLDQIQVKT